MKITKAVIPAAGLGTRLYPATKSQPKEMLPLGTRPTIQGVAEELVGADLTDILIVTGRQKRAIEDHFDPSDGLDPDNKCPRCAELFNPGRVHFFYTRQSKPQGLGDAVAQAKRFVGQEHFVVALGDCVITSDTRASLLRRMLELHEGCDAAATIAVQRVPPEDTSRYGIVAPAADASGVGLKLRDIVEKPGPERAPSDLAVCARYVFSAEVFSFLAETPPDGRGEVQLTDAIRRMIAAGMPVYAVPLVGDEERLDVGSFESYAQSFMRVMLADPEYGPKLRPYAENLLARLAEKESAARASK